MKKRIRQSLVFLSLLCVFSVFFRSFKLSVRAEPLDESGGGIFYEEEPSIVEEDVIPPLCDLPEWSIPDEEVEALSVYDEEQDVDVYTDEAFLVEQEWYDENADPGMMTYAARAAGITAVSDKNNVDGLLDYPNGSVQYLIAAQDLGMDRITIEYQKLSGSTWVTDNDPPFRYDASVKKLFYLVSKGGSYASSPKSITDRRVKITFPGAVLGSDGQDHDLNMTLSNFYFKSRNGNASDVNILYEEDEYGSACTISSDMDRSDDTVSFFDITLQVIGASNTDRLFMMLYDIDVDREDPGSYSFSNHSFIEAVKIMSGIYPGTQPHVPNDYYMVINDSGQPEYFALSNVSDEDSYKAAVSWLACATGTTYRWSGSQCKTGIGIDMGYLPSFRIKTQVRTETAASPVNGTKTYEDYYTVHNRLFLRLMSCDYSHTYTLARLLSDKGLSSSDDWIYDYSGKTVGGTGVKTNTVYSITINRNRYTYSFDANPPSGVSSSSITNMPSSKTVVAQTGANGKSDASVNTPSLTGFWFMGWNTKADGTGTSYPGAETMKSNKTFYAQWQPATYTVHFHANGSVNPDHQTGEFTQNTVTGTMSDQTLHFDRWENLSANAYARVGYTFAGWNTKSDGTGTAYSDRQSVKNLIGYDKSEITLYAQWTKKFGTETLTVVDEITRDPVKNVSLKLQKSVNGVWTDISTKTTNANGQITVNGLHWFNYRWVMTSVPTGYRMATSHTTFTITYNRLSATNEITLIRIRYKVRYDGNGASNPNHQTGEFTQNTVTGTMADSEYTYGVKGTLRTNAYQREGYTFQGWNTKADGSGTSYADKYNNVLNWTSEDGKVITLYAQWEKKLGTETVTVVSEETGNPVKNVSLKLQKSVNGVWTDVRTGVTNDSGQITVNGLHWFNYRWVMTGVPAGYVKSADTAFTITYNRLSAENRVILYMQHVSIILDSQVSDIIKGERAPAFLYQISGTDVAGVRHTYHLLVQTNDVSKLGSNRISGLFAGTYTVTQTPVSRYVPDTAVSISHATISGINATVDVKNHTSAEVKFPYTIREYGWYYGVNSKANRLTR